MKMMTDRSRLIIGTVSIVCGAGCVQRHGVCPSVCRFAAVGPRIDRLLPGAQQQRRAAGECGQCHVVSLSVYVGS